MKKRLTRICLQAGRLLSFSSRPSFGLSSFLDSPFFSFCVSSLPFSLAVSSLFFWSGDITVTGWPFTSESGGLMTTRSSAFNPAAISTVLPKSRPMVIVCSTALFCSSTVATCKPSTRKISVLTGRINRAFTPGQFQMHLGKPPGEEFIIFVRQHIFHQHRTARGINRFGCFNKRRREFLAGMIVHLHRRLHLRGHTARIILRHANVNPQLMRPEPDGTAAAVSRSPPLPACRYPLSARR